MVIEYLFAQFQRVHNCPAGSSDVYDPEAKGNCLTNLPQVAAGGESLNRIFAIVFAVAAGVALISLMIAALNYVTAFSDKDKIVRSRRNIIYSLIGLVLALRAETIVLTVVGRL